MRFNTRTVSANEKSRWLPTLRWCAKHRQVFGGLPYDDQLSGSGGITLDLLVPVGTPTQMVHLALREAYAMRDVVNHQVLYCPQEWFIEASTVRFCKDTLHDFVASHGFGGPTELATTLAVIWFWQGYSYAEIGAEIAFRGLCAGTDAEVS